MKAKLLLKPNYFLCIYKLNPNLDSWYIFGFNVASLGPSKSLTVYTVYDNLNITKLIKLM